MITGGHLKTPVPVKHFVTVQGTMYFKMCKSDAVMTRLFVSDATRLSGRPLSMTNIVEQLSGLRDMSYHDLAFPKDETDGKEDLGLDAPSRPVPKALTELPASVSVFAPDIDGVSGLEMRVLMCKPGQPLWLELNQENIQYLVEVVDRQISMGDIKRAHPRLAVDDIDRVHSDIKGVSYSYKRNSVRVTGKVDGKVATKYFRVKSNESLEESMKDAAAWLTENSPSSCTTEITPLQDDMVMGALEDQASAEDVGLSE